VPPPAAVAVLATLAANYANMHPAVLRDVVPRLRDSLERMLTDSGWRDALKAQALSTPAVLLGEGAARVR